MYDCQGIKKKSIQIGLRINNKKTPYNTIRWKLNNTISFRNHQWAKKNEAHEKKAKKEMRKYNIWNMNFEW